MPLEEPAAPPRSILERSADNGLYLGLYLSAMVLALGFSSTFAPASLLVWGGTLAMPFYLYRMLRRSAASGSAAGFAELWAEGIASFFLGTLLPALITYICLRFLAPTFIADTIGGAVQFFEAQADPELQAWAARLESAAARGGLPTAVDVCAQLISFNIIAGTALSFLAAVAVSVAGAIPKKQKS